MLRILTFNANGIRSAAKKGFFEWFMEQNADILCIQELKAQEADLSDELKSLPGYHGFFHCARKKGYSGCGLWSRRVPDAVREVVLCGDVNIAHKEIDIKNWKGNLDHSGFLPEERAWLDHLFDEMGWVDVFRRLDPRPERYTWWSQRGQARAKNVGWRIDYELATPVRKFV